MPIVACLAGAFHAQRRRCQHALGMGTQCTYGTPPASRAQRHEVPNNRPTGLSGTQWVTARPQGPLPPGWPGPRTSRTAPRREGAGRAHDCGCVLLSTANLPLLPDQLPWWCGRWCWLASSWLALCRWPQQVVWSPSNTGSHVEGSVAIPVDQLAAMWAPTDAMQLLGPVLVCNALLLLCALCSSCHASCKVVCCVCK